MSNQLTEKNRGGFGNPRPLPTSLLAERFEDLLQVFGCYSVVAHHNYATPCRKLSDFPEVHDWHSRFATAMSVKFARARETPNQSAGHEQQW